MNIQLSWFGVFLVAGAAATSSRSLWELPPVSMAVPGTGCQVLLYQTWFSSRDIFQRIHPAQDFSAEPRPRGQERGCPSQNAGRENRQLNVAGQGKEWLAGGTASSGSS